MKVVPAAKDRLDRAHRAPVMVEHTRLTVVQSPDVADPGAVEEALELLVKWAIRAHQGNRSARADTATPTSLAACIPGDST